jgi:DNA-binding transcriptional regulator GbsR (MarR family)
MKEIEHDFAEFVKRINSNFGFDSTTSEIVAVLFLELEEISMDELAKRIGYSLASVSIKIRQMQALEIVECRTKPGSRKIYVYMKKDIVEMVKNKLMMVYQYKIKPAKEYLPTIIERFKGKKLDENARKKLELIKNHQKGIERIEKVLLNAIAELSKEGGSK